MNLATIPCVYVPFEIGFDGLEKRRTDLPIFLTTEGARKYLQRYPRLGKYKLEWRQHSEKDLIEEYVKRWYEQTRGT